MASILSREEFLNALPKKMRKTVNPQLIDDINEIITSSEAGEHFKDNLLSFSTVIKEGRFKMHCYINAVRYCTFKLLGETNIASYIKTFPEKYQGMLDRGVLTKDIASYVSAFNKSKLVMRILEQSLVPIFLVNAEVYQKAINVQADLMINAKSERVRTTAADSLLNHLKRPETSTMQLDITVKEDESISELRAVTKKLVEQQRQAIANNTVTAETIANSRLWIQHKDES